MKIFIDCISGAEVLSDIFPIEEVNNGLILKVKGKLTTMTQGGDFNTGANASAEEAADSVEGTTTSGINIALNHQLDEWPMDKKNFRQYIKDYMKAVKAEVEKNGGDVKKFMKEANTFVTGVLAEFDEYKFYAPEKTVQNGEGQYVLCKWDEETPYMFYFKDGLIEEKV